jgi:hypothetical protein
MIALSGAALALLGAFMVLAAGAEPPRVDARDREVLEAALKDMLNPKNPEYRNEEPDYRPPTRKITIILDRLAGGDGDKDVFQGQKMISKELMTSWQRRNSGGQIPLEKTGIQDKSFIIVDTDKLYEESQKTNKYFWELFYERYPGSRGYAQVSLPGYSRAGTVAVVEIRITRAEYHPVIWLMLLTQFEGRWNVGWRHVEVW